MSAVGLTVMIPALNEERNLEPTVRNVQRAASLVPDLTYEIVMVNDGSSDRTGAIMDRLAQEYDNIKVIHHPVNRGIGCALHSSLDVAEGEKLVMVASDNDMAFDLMYTLFSNAHVADLVLCYFVNKEMRGRRRNILSAFFGLTYMTVFDIFVQYINAPCLYPTQWIRETHLVSTRFSIASELTVKLLRKGVSFYEIPGYMQTGLDGSGSLSWKSLKEVIATFLKLVWEIHFQTPHLYNKRPRRVMKAPLAASPEGVILPATAPNATLVAAQD